ncbi:unnamed protein product [Orchesella dallaii]|uniref:Uncharacterized protein n=1 Tax=Orchesella dallaii TaxID=48710 RepID=A0ABP1S1H0_9HEXA
MPYTENGIPESSPTCKGDYTQNPDIVLVHYLNVPYPDDNKLIVTTNVSMWGDKKEWTKEELISQLKPMFFSEEEPDLNNELELSTAETVEAIVIQLMEKQRLARQSVSISGDTLVSVSKTPNNANSSPLNQAVLNVNSSGASISGSGCGGVPAGRLSSSSSSSSSLQHLPNLPTTGPSVTMTASVASSMGTNSLTFPSSVPEGCDVTVDNLHHNRLASTVNMTATSGSSVPERPFVLNLSQFQTAGGLIILNGKPTTASVTCHSSLASTQPVAARNQTNDPPPLTSGEIVSNKSASVTTSMTSFMDAQNANIHASKTSSGCSTTTISNSNQTVFIHHSQHQHHFSSSTLTTKPSQHPVQHQRSPLTSDIRLQPPQMQIPQHIVHHGGGPGHRAHIQTNINGHALTAPLKYEATQDIQATSQHQHHLPQQHIIQRQLQAHPFYQQETLDMSHEDIQQTLTANMGVVDTTGDLEPMSPSADDVFVNLDAFDILADLSDDVEQHQDGGLIGSLDKNTIVDINPEWAYSEGGTKILIVGQFSNPHQDYSVHFGDLPVPAVYLQVGVLKCFCPQRCKTETFWDSVDMLTKLTRKSMQPINTLVESGGKLAEKEEISDALVNAFLVKEDNNCKDVDIVTPYNHCNAKLSQKTGASTN